MGGWGKFPVLRPNTIRFAVSCCFSSAPLPGFPFSCFSSAPPPAPAPPPPTPPYLISTPIFYVNSVPHIGHLYSALLADAHFRFRGLVEGTRGGRRIFSTGTDEHGLKIQQAANTAGKSPALFCDEVSHQFRDLFEENRISYTDYVRTTQQRHKDVVTSIWNQLMSDGHIYRTVYSSWYSVQDETFLTNTQVEERSDGEVYSLESGHRVEWASEDNYCFRLTDQKERIKEWILTQNPIKPAQFSSQVLAWLDDPKLGDLSVSRPVSRLQWGIPVPPPHHGDTIYVWLDALVNYLTVAGHGAETFTWPPTVQVIGKDILKFHAVYWPGILLALGLPLPKTILVHSHWLVDDVKMSKSLGNVVNPRELNNRLTVEGTRYALLREGVPHSDGNFALPKLVRYLNTELADTLGNLVNRLTSKGVNPNQFVPPWKPHYSASFGSTVSEELMQKLDKLPDLVYRAYDNFNFYQGIVQTMDILRLTNLFVQEEKPWELKKSNPERLDFVLALGLESLRVSGILLSPVVPEISRQLLDKLHVPQGGARDWNAATQLCWRQNQNEDNPKGRQLGEEKIVLFRKIKDAEL